MALELAPSYNNFGATSFDRPFLVIALVYVYATPPQQPIRDVTDSVEIGSSWQN